MTGILSFIAIIAIITIIFWEASLKKGSLKGSLGILRTSRFGFGLLLPLLLLLLLFYYYFTIISITTILLWAVLGVPLKRDPYRDP